MSADVPPFADANVAPDILQLAARFEIQDPEALEDALHVAFDEAEEARISDSPRAHFPEYAQFEMEACEGLTNEREIAQHARLVTLVASLRKELEDVNLLTGLTTGNPAASLLEVLKAYAEWLSLIKYKEMQPRRGAPSDIASRAFVLSLARDWPTLTGTPPTAWRDSYTGEGGGKFYAFLQALWPDRWPDANVLPWVEFPSVSTVQRWMASIS